MPLSESETLGYDKPIIVEEFFIKEITVGLIGNPPETYTPFLCGRRLFKLPAGLPRIRLEAKWIEHHYLLRSSVNLPEKQKNPD
jgi:hypothetical protein